MANLIRLTARALARRAARSEVESKPRTRMPVRVVAQTWVVRVATGCRQAQEALHTSRVAPAAGAVPELQAPPTALERSAIPEASRSLRSQVVPAELAERSRRVATNRVAQRPVAQRVPARNRADALRAHPWN